MQLLPVALKDGYVTGSAEARRILDDNIQHGLELGRRGANDSENLGDRRLLFERVGELAPA
jgi:hypothetical protein